MKCRLRNNRGSAVAYLFLAIFLAGLVVVTMMRGSEVSTVNTQLQSLKGYLSADIESIRSAVNECILIHSEPVDLNDDGVINAADNPNPPYPVYDDLSTGEDGENIRDIRCPGSGALILSPDTGRFFRLFRAADYNVVYYNNDTQGVYFRAQPLFDSPLWNEAIIQLAATDSSGCIIQTDFASGSCSERGCLDYWIKPLTCP